MQLMPTTSLAADLARTLDDVLAAISRARSAGLINVTAPDISPEPAGASAAGALDILRDRLDLSPTELRVLWVLAGYELDTQIRQLVTALADDPRSPTIGALLAIVYVRDEQRGIAELGSKLVAHQLVEIDPADSHAAFARRRIRASDRIVELATGIARLDPALDGIASVDATPASTLGTLVLAAGVRDRMRAALQSELGGIVVAHGCDGSGRRALLAAGLAAEGRRALVIDASALASDSMELRAQLGRIARECRLFELVPLIRAIDKLSAESLALVEPELGALPLITATATSLPARRWRRAPIAIELAPPSPAQYAELWGRALPQASAGDAELLAKRYPLAPAIVVAVGEAACRHCGDAVMQPTHIESALRHTIDNRFAGLATRVEVTQTWADLVLPADQQTAIAELIARVRERRVIYEDWGFGGKLGRGLGVSALLSGPPGTGKTMTAGLVARSLGAELYQVDLSQIASKWIGETEKNLAALFDAASAGNAVLMFDEADALFGKRTEVRTSNDRHANQQVNYLLQRIESFTGICILTTNHESAIDDAFRRRLAVHIRYALPEADERRRLWRTLLPEAAPVCADLPFDALAATYAMSGGCIRNAVIRAAFLAANAKQPIGPDHLNRAAQLEYETMGKISPIHAPISAAL